MANWRERGYVPDSDDEEDESLTRQITAPVSSHGPRRDELTDTENLLDTLSSIEQTANRPSDPPESSLVLNRPLRIKSSTRTSPQHPGGQLYASTANQSTTISVAAEETEFPDALSVADQLQAELRRGLDVLEEIRSSPPPPPGAAYDTDSPLSSPPESPSQTLRLISETVPLIPEQTSSAVQASQAPFSDRQWQVAPLVRSFRPRTAVQLQPYTLDGAKHRTEWQSRGLRPVHTHQPAENTHRGPRRREEDSQGDETFASSQQVSSPPRPNLRPIALGSDTLTNRPETTEPDLEEMEEFATDDELPDIADILNFSRNAGKVPSRRRLYFGTRRVPRVEVSDRTSKDIVSHRSEIRTSDSGSIFDLPPSPPRSGSEPPTGLFSTAVTPRRPPTPLVSSDRQTAKRNFVEIASSPDETDPPISGAVASSSEESAVEEPKGLVHIRRRIRGVLPASWIRLDAQQQKGKTDKHAASRSPEKRPLKGVARHVSPRSGPRSSARPLLIEYGSSEEEPTESSQQRAGVVARGAALHSFFDSDQQSAHMEDVDEEDTIDRMVPINPRRTGAGRSRKPRQQRLNDVWNKGAPRRQSTTFTSTAPSAGAARSAKPDTKRFKKRSRPAQLSILDAPGLVRLDHQHQPTFLRIAARSKTPGHRPRPQDPAQKFFQLATREDTADVNEGLSQWRRESRGAHKGCKTRTNTTSHRGDRSHPRQLASTAAQQQQQARFRNAPHSNDNSMATTLQILKNSTDATLSRLQHQADLQTSGSAIPAPHSTSTAPPKLNAGFVSWHGNRAGRGNFWNQILERPAPQETPVVLPSRLKPIRRSAMFGSQPAQTRTDQVPALEHGEPSSTARRSKPKKQLAPRRTTTSATVDAPELVHGHMNIDAIKTPTTPTNPGPQLLVNTVALLAVSTPANIARPPTDAKLQLSVFICEGKLTAVMKTLTMDDLNEPRHPIDHFDAVLRTPKTDKSLPCTSNIPQTMTFIQEVIEEAMESVTTTTALDVSEKASASIELIIQYMDEAVKHCVGPIRDTMIMDMIQLLDSSLTFLSSQFKGGATVNILALLNRLMILAYQASAASRVCSTETSKAAVGLWARARRMTLEMILGIAGLKKLVEIATAWETVNIDWATVVYLESLILWFQLTQELTPREIQKDLFQASTRIYGDSAESPMAVVMSLLPLLYSISFLDTSALFNDLQQTHFDPWSVLGPALRAFLEAFSKKESLDRTSVRLGLKALTSCLSLATDCGWEVPDSLLQLLFQHYGKNDMIELFLEATVSQASERVAGNFDASPEMAHTDFEIFLRLVTTSLEQKISSLNDTSTASTKKNKIVSLVFSLTPNNSRVVDEQEILENQVLQAIANTYALYVTLYSSAPRGCRPRVAHIENLLDFSTSHAQVRNLTIAAWARMSRSAVTQGANVEELQALGHLGHKMWKALANKVTTKLDANSLATSYFRYDLDFKNCKPVIIQMTTMLRKWLTIIDSCAFDADVEVIISPDLLVDLVHPLQFLQDHIANLRSQPSEIVSDYISKLREHDLDIWVLKLLRSIYTRLSTIMLFSSHNQQTPTTLLPQVFNSARDIISSIMSSDSELSARLEMSVRIWFDIAKIQVDNVRDRWSKYLEDGATLSFRLLADTKISQQCETLFLSHIVEAVPAYFELDPEALYSRLLRCILKPECDLRFEHILLSQVMIHNPGPLALHEISNLLDRSTSGGILTLKTFMFYRTDIVKHIVHCIYNLQFGGPDDSQDLIEDLVDEASGRRLLMLMTDILRANWLRTNNGSGDVSYTKFVQAIAHELEIYTFPGFKLSTWFTDAQTSEFTIAEDRFKLLFTRARGSFSRVLDAAFIVRFRQDNQKASNTPRQAEWIRKMVAALSCNSMFEDLDTNDKCIMDGQLQVQFMQNVLSVYVQFAFSKGPRLAVWTIPVVQILTQVIRTAHCRQDLDEGARLEEFAAMCLELVIRARQALDALVRQDAIRRRHIMLLAIKLIELATACISRIHGFRRIAPSSDHIGDLFEPMAEMAVAIHACITDPRFDARPARDDNPASDATMHYHPAHFAPAAVPGTHEHLRRATVDDMDAALARGRQPLGLGENWAFWYQPDAGGEGVATTHAGWEDELGPAGELTALAKATEEFCRTVSAEVVGVVDVDGAGWRVWENLRVFGTRTVPEMSAEEIELAVVEELYVE